MAARESDDDFALEEPKSPGRGPAPAAQAAAKRGPDAAEGGAQARRLRSWRAV